MLSERLSIGRRHKLVRFILVTAPLPHRLDDIKDTIALVVGGAITRPAEITARFTGAINAMHK